ncbi:hypothetical protein BGZ81_003782 [Podila clonocystis]|nr:hypothetical protein BGZ81_003782 [Podila clonocystis]
MEDIKNTSEETVRTLNAVPASLPSCSEYRGSITLAQIHNTQMRLFGDLSPILPARGNGTTSVDSSMLPEDDEHMDRNKAVILHRQQQEFLKGGEEGSYVEDSDVD